MSRKSRQKGARNMLAHAIPFTWLAAVMLIGALGLCIFGFLSPWISKPIPLEDTIPVSAAMKKVEATYDARRRHRELDNILIYFEDHERLMISNVLAHDALLEKLEAYPAGTVFDMHVQPNGTDIMTLSVAGADVLSYEAACRAITANNAFGVILGVIMLPIAIYAAWSLVIRWRYRRLL